MSNPLHRWFLLQLVCCLIIELPAQDRPYFQSVRGHTGFIIPHAPAIRDLAKAANPWGVQVEVSKLNLSDESWKKCHCYGRDGLVASYFNFDNSDELGRSLSLMYFAEGYLKAIGDVKLSIRGSVGVVHLNKVYDSLSNPENQFFSSQINFFLGLSTTLYYHLNEQWAINLAGNYNHISNAGGKQPNKGMNFPTLSIGVDRTIHYQAIQPKPDEMRTFDKNLTWIVGGFGSLRSANERSEGSKYPMIGLVSDIMFPVSGINGFNAGLEFSFDDSYRERLERRNINQSAWITSFLAGHQFTFGGVYLLQQFGWYIAKPDAVQRKDFFQRYSGYFKVRNWAIGASLIAYANVADHMDVRLVYFLKD